jgi:Eukaryotic membrane protein family
MLRYTLSKFRSHDIYLQVGDKLLSALGQDVLECLFSREVLDRNPDGRSKVIRPLWVFMIALIYTIIHSSALLYQVITLNVAVNSYSNALLTLLVSNQFVEIKGAVFKKVEKENLFQMTCADVVERFQIWIMLLIIAMRNMVEVGSLNISLSSSLESSATAAAAGANATDIPIAAVSGFIPQALSILPKLTGPVLGPFLMVLGSETLVDWIKHAYVDKFNDTRPTIYARFLDVLASDYYAHALGDQNLTKRIGLPTLPLACLFVRTTIQTYHMFLATHLPLPLPSPATSLVNAHTSDGPETKSTPGTVAALAHVDVLFRRALGRSGFPDDSQMMQSGSWIWRLASYSLDEFVALCLLLLLVVLVFLALLAAKLVLGLVLLHWSRIRVDSIRTRERAERGNEREKEPVHLGSKRLGVNGMVEVHDEAKRRIYEGDENGLAKAKEKDERGRRERERGRMELGGVTRYAMVAKRIW